MDSGQIRKKILVVFSAELVPVTMMNQNRTVTMMKRLAADHEIDLLTADINDLASLKKILPGLNNIFFYKHHSHFGKLRKVLFYLKTCFLTCLLLFPEHYHSIINRSLQKKIKNLLKTNGYNFILLHYWYLEKILPKKRGKYSVIIDTHGLIFQKVKLEAKQHEGFVAKNIDNIYAIIYKRQELNSLKKANLLIFNAQKDQNCYEKELNGKTKSITISNGQIFTNFVKSAEIRESKTILFYGSLGSLQNQQAFQIFWNKIYPFILKKNPEVKLIVLGNNPPPWISNLKSDQIIVTGYVEDTKPFIAESKVCILPLQLGSGFRGRVIEVMALGVPVVGTHNALDSVNMINGLHGVVTDNYDEMIEYTNKILENSELSSQLADNCIRFVRDNFDIESTYGKLSDFLLNWNIIAK